MAQNPKPSNVVPFRKPAGSGGPRFQLPAWFPRELVGTATGWIVLANLIVWLAMIVASYGAGVLTRFPVGITHAFGALDPELIPTEPWRMLSSTFVHADIGHIAMNMAILWFTGRQLERAYGAGRFTSLYFVAALMGSVFSLVWHLLASPGTSVGASGGVLGVVAGLAVFFWRATGRKSELTKQWIWFCALGLIGGMITSALGMPVDNAAHLGGMIGGGLVSWMFAGRPAFSPSLSRAILGAGTLLAVASIVLSVVVGSRIQPLRLEDLVPASQRAASAALEAKDYETAEKELAKAVREVPDDPNLRTLHAGALAELGRTTEAERELVAAETLLVALRRREPASAWAALAHASVLDMQDRRDEATEALVEAVDAEGTAETFGKIAEHLLARGRLEDARKAAAKARTRDSGNSEFRELHERIKARIANPDATETPAPQ